MEKREFVRLAVEIAPEAYERYEAWKSKEGLRTHGSAFLAMLEAALQNGSKT